MENQKFESTHQGEELKTTENSAMNDKMAKVGWSLFFIWIGLVWLLELGSGVALLGIGAVTLGMQAVRNYFNLKLEGFWLAIGALFVVSGIWELFTVKLPLAPIVVIAAGVLLLVSIIKGKKTD